MAQKVNPTSLRLQLSKDWQSKWFASKDAYRKFLSEDLKVRRFLEKKLDRRAGLDRVEIERGSNQVNISLFTARPGVIIGRGGAGIEELKVEIQKILNGPVKLTIEEVKKPELKAKLVADNIAGQLERRISFRRAMKATADSTIRAGAKGVKIVVAGRLNGSEMARTEKELLGSIPLHTLKANIEYGQSVAKTTYGAIGVKVWVYRGEES